MKAFHGEIELKKELLAEPRHYKFRPQVTWLYDKGELKYGVPKELIMLRNEIFSALPREEAREFASRFTEVIPIGADLSLVWPKFIVRLLTRVKKYMKGEEAKALNKIISLCKKQIAGEKVSEVCGRGVITSAITAGAVKCDNLATDHITTRVAYVAANAALNLEKESKKISYDCMVGKNAWDSEVIKQRDDLLELLREAKP